MDNKEVGQYWDKNAENWTKLARLGYDRSRNLINSPAFFNMLPEISNLKGLDIGCGEGYNTRLASKLGAEITAIDISKVFIKYAKDYEEKKPLGIEYRVASATNLPFPDNYFDFALATMSLMDMADNEKAIKETYRVLKTGGFFQFSITHPCFGSKGYEWVKDEKGKATGFIVKDYFKNLNGEIEKWIFGAAPKKMTDKMKKFIIPRFTRTLSDWLNLLIEIDYVLEEFCEPSGDSEFFREYPEKYKSLIIPYCLIIRCRKSH